MPHIDHYFQGGGEFAVTLKVTDNEGGTGTITRGLNVPQTIEMPGRKYGGPVSAALASKAGYDIEVTTGAQDGAGTNARVSIALFGPRNADGELTGTAEFQLFDALDEAHSDAFENGRTDVFKSHQGKSAGLPDSSSLDQVDFITIRHDNQGDRPGWYVKSVKIRNQANGKEWRFEPEVWLDWDEAPLKAVMGRFTPIGADYPCGILFSGNQRSWGMIEASNNVFILKPGADSFYFTSLDRADQIEVYQNNVLAGRQYARGSGLVTAPYIAAPEFGLQYQASLITSPTKFSVIITHPNATTAEAVVWVFPPGWRDYAREARQAALIYPLKGSTSFFSYGDSVLQFMSNVYSFESSLNAALGVVMGYASKALGIFGGPGDSQLKGSIEERVGIYVAKGLNGVLKTLGMTLANSIFSQTIGLFESMIRAREWAQQLESVGSAAAASAGGLQYLGRLASCNPGLLASVRMLGVIKMKLDSAMTEIDRNNPSGYRSIMAKVREIAVGKNPASVLEADYLIGYAGHGIVDPNGDSPSDNYCLGLWCILEFNNIQRWKTGNEIGLCFPSDVLYGWTDAEKKAETQSAMGTYEPLFKNIMMVAGVAISVALLD